MRTSELTGKALSYTLCMVELPHLVWGKTIGLHEHSNQIVVPELSEPQCYSPFMDWAQGGPIIERENISISFDFSREYPEGGWSAEFIDEEECEMHQGYGPTPLIAAMRCYVASKLGDEVEIPKELT